MVDKLLQRVYGYKPNYNSLVGSKKWQTIMHQAINAGTKT